VLPREFCYDRTGMGIPDLNLLVTLDALLSEGSVARAARRLRLSPSAMSRALARLREVMGDPLLVRAGRGLVPTPRAIAVRDAARQLVQDAEAMLRPTERLDLARLERTFTLRARDGFVETLGASLIARVGREAPRVKLAFVGKPDKDSAPLRDGLVDLELGVVGQSTGPEVRAQALFRDRFVGVVRTGHVLASETVTPQAYAAGRHVLVALRKGPKQGPVEAALQMQGLAREVAVTVDSFSAALAVARGSDLIATVPARSTAAFRADLHSFALPFAVDEFAISLLWHPRQDGDAAHRWLRQCVKDAYAEAEREM